MSNQCRQLLSYDEANCDDGHGLFVRDYYERLITEGKLRVVEEVTVSSDYYCSLCHFDCSDAARDFADGTSSFIYNYCPGCGNHIKRP